MKIKLIFICLYCLFAANQIYSQCKLDSLIYNEYYNVSSKETRFKIYNLFDKNDSNVGLIQLNYNAMTGYLENYIKIENILDNKGIIIQVFDSLWNGTNWFLYSKRDITRDLAGNQTKNLNYTWNSTKSSFDTLSRLTFSYDIKNKLIETVGQTWNKSNQSWENQQRTQWIDSVQVRKQFQFDQIWNKDSLKWLNNYLYENKLDANNLVTKMMRYQWYCSSPKCQWILIKEDNIYYDEFLRDTVTISKYGTGNINYVIKSFYNQSGCRILDETYTPKAGGGFLISDETLYYQHLTHTTNISNKIKSDFEIYPNPCSDILVIRNANESDFILSEIGTGKIVYTGSLNIQLDSIDVSAISSGLYLLTFVKSNKKFKILINHQ